MVLKFDATPEFQKDVKKLAKKWRSIPDDIEQAKRAITPLYTPIDGVDIKDFRDSFFATSRATILTSTETYEIVKMRLDCMSLGSDKKTRLVFIMIRTDDTIQFVELYAKNANEQHDQRRLKEYIP